MQRCLDLAREAAACGEVPVGALVVLGDRVIGSGRNRCEQRGHPLAHAEMEALDEAFRTVGEGRLPEAELFCTLEPCFMCAGAVLHARLRRIVFAARDPKFGAIASLAELGRDLRLNHRCEILEGVCADASAGLLRQFFRRLR